MKFEIKINNQKRERISNFEKPVFDFSAVLNPKKSGLSKKLKVSHWIFEISSRYIKVSNSKVPSSDYILEIQNNFVLLNSSLIRDVMI